MKLLSNIVLWFMAGFAFGFLGSVAYLLVEGPPLFYPEWASIMGYPGITVGEWAYYGLHVSEFMAEALGCLINGLSYGFVLLLPGIFVQIISEY